MAGLQLAHVGYKASTQPLWEGGQFIPIAEGGWQNFSLSKVLLSDGKGKTEALTSEGIQ